jgi:hypothetical protein
MVTPLERLEPSDRRSLTAARDLLEHPSLAARLTSLVGLPLEEAVRLLPTAASERVHRVAEGAILRALAVALRSLPGRAPAASRTDLHRVLGMATGAAGGFFGLPGTLAELPVSTTLMLRSIADIARSHGENLDDATARLACVEVFAYGGRRTDDDAAETGYYGLRMALAFHLSTVSRNLIERGLAQASLPATVQLARAVAARFGIAVSDKLALQMVPVAGAISGATLNAIFMQHFQDMAHGHFTVRRLERAYDLETVRAAYEALADEEPRHRRDTARTRILEHHTPGD